MTWGLHWGRSGVRRAVVHVSKSGYFPQTRPVLGKTAEHRWVLECLFLCVVHGGQMWPGQLSARLAGVGVAGSHAARAW